MIYLELFWGFLQVGLFAFGGAYGAIPLIRDVVLANGWISDEALTYMIAVSESTPGPITINLATYIGSNMAGMVGAIIATAAVAFPAFIIVLLIMVILNKILKNKYVKAVLSNLKPCIIGIILATGFFMITENCFLRSGAFIFSLKELIITVALGCILFISRRRMKKRLSPIILIVIAALMGIVAYI